MVNLDNNSQCYFRHNSGKRVGGDISEGWLQSLVLPGDDCADTECDCFSVVCFCTSCFLFILAA